MDIPLFLYLTHLLTGFYALLIHFHRPSTGPSAPTRQKLIILLTGATIALTGRSIFNQRATPPSNSNGDRALPANAAAALLLAAVTLFVWAALHTAPRRFAIIYSDVRPGYVVRTGPFAWVRHPTYASYVLGWTGSVVLMAAAPDAHAAAVAAACACLAALVWLYGDAADLEERQFAGAGVPEGVRREYEVYRARTARWVPGVY